MSSEEDEIVVVTHERDDLTAEQVEAIRDLVRRWFDDPEAQRRLMEGQERAAREIARLREARKIDPEDLRRPMTI